MPAATTTRIRKDPKQRHVSGQAQTFNGTPGWTVLHNQRPDRVYKMVYKGGAESNQIGRYEEMGYEIEKWGDPNDKTRLRFGTGKGASVQGEVMEHSGHVVMSIDKAEHDRQQAEGDGMGGFGQSYADMVQRAIRRGTGVQNPLRGRVGRFGTSLTLGRSDSRDGSYEEPGEGYDEIEDED